MRKIINDGGEISGSFSDYLSLMLDKPHKRLNNLKTSLRFPCLGLNPIIESINLTMKVVLCLDLGFLFEAQNNNSDSQGSR